MAKFKGKMINEAIVWIANNDDPCELDEGTVACYISVALVASLFHVKSDDVAKEVVKYRKSNPQEGFTYE